MRRTSRYDHTGPARARPCATTGPSFSSTGDETQRKEYREATLAAVRECCRQFAREFPCSRLWIFGSLVTGRFHRQSDIDIAAEGLPEPSFFKAHAYLMRCVPADHEIDLKPFEALAAPVRQRIETEGELLVG